MNSLDWWSSAYGEVAPVGHALRSLYHEIWIRFHSLPESKRYPESEEEVQEVIRRAVMVAGALFEVGEHLIAYKSNFHYEESSHPKFESIAGSPTESSSIFLRANPGSVAQEDDDYFITWAREDTWPPPYFERLVREVAAFNETLVCLVSPRSGNIFCPYDGGIDIFVPSSEQRKSLSFLNGWRSKRSDGM